MMLRIALFLCTLAWTGAAPAEVRPISFAPGAKTAVISGAVVRGTRDVFSFEGYKGQSADIAVKSTENNAAMTIWQPGANVNFGEFVDIEGQTLPGAGEEDDASKWRGRLPKSGLYLIVVGSTRGNATYELKVKVGKQAPRH